MTERSRQLPVAGSDTGLKVLHGLMKDRSLLTALQVMHQQIGDAFQITLPGFQPAVLIGPEANRQILVTDRHKLLWRNETDPVTHLLGHGVLVVDGVEHEYLRNYMDPLLQRRHVIPHIRAMWRYTDDVTATWVDGERRDMLVDMRRVALLILMGTLFRVEFEPDMDRLWQPIIRLLEFISPGLWVLWPEMPRPRYRRAIQEMDAYLFQLIQQRRAELINHWSEIESDDLLSRLVKAPGITDELIRDQLLTMLIAGHDTSTALLAWVLYLLGCHPASMAQVQEEVDTVLTDNSQPPSFQQLNQLHHMDQVIKETLRLYPPIHVGSRVAATDIAIQGYEVPAGTRVMYSIYLAHRDQAQWAEPDRFCPARFDRRQAEKRQPLAYVPFGGGPRNCIGAAFARIEAKVVLSRLLQQFEFQFVEGQRIRTHMGATLEPRPGVIMRVRRRRLHHAS